MSMPKHGLAGQNRKTDCMTDESLVWV